MGGDLSDRQSDFLARGVTRIGSPPSGCVVSFCTGQGLVSATVSKRKRDRRTPSAITASCIAKLAPMAVTMTKETMWANLQAPSLDHALAFESRTQVMTRNTGDAAEARLAFLEKRDPVFDAPDNPRPVR